jgi:hypothetical protein
MYPATLWWLPSNVCGKKFSRRAGKRVNIGRNSETEHPIGPHFIACSRKKAAVTPYFFIKYGNNMYLAILWCLQYVCRNFFSRNMVQWTWGAFSTFQTIFYREPDSVRYLWWHHLLVLVHVNCLEITLESFFGSIRAQKCILCGI